jgi:hypothetical protein
MEIFHTHGYKKGTEVLIDAEFLMGVLSYVDRVIESQPKIAVPMVYPKESLEIKEKDSDELIRVDVNWVEYPSQRSFANTAFGENGAVPIQTELSLLGFQIKQALYEYHQRNINNGIAVEIPKNEK